MPLLLLLLVIPLIEIMLFIQVGGAIGVWPTIGIVILTAVAGAYILRRQGLASLRKVQSRLAAGENPGRLMADGAMVMIAGVLLLAPGFLTDTIGLILLIPPVRGVLFRWMARRIAVVTVQAQRSRRVWPGGETVEGEFEEIDPDARRDGGRDDAGDGVRPIGHDRR
ncbi:MAG TPA: FxsA family protein [Paracoccaceae bacterium]|nr:FxsA family protein [Paracoccaceae bacterium]